jgi:DNA processing protein
MSACDVCLRRSNVIAAVAPRIEGMLGRRDSRVADILALSDEDMVAALAPRDRAPEVRRAIDEFEPDCAREAAADADAAVICRHDLHYPERLRQLRDGPAVLWMRGGLASFDDLIGRPGVAIVGSRRPSAYGIEVAEELGRGLSASGVTVISGLALGIDAAAHRGALRAPEPRTIAVLGCGVDVPYPRVNERLYHRICEQGVVISELPPGRHPYRWSFPARNRIMAALSAMTVVVEAADPSGSLITATFAAELGRGVCAVPGRVTAGNAAGSNKLLRDGAAVIRGPEDVLDELFGIGGADRLAASPPATAELGDDAVAVLAAVEAGADSGSIGEAIGLDPAAVRAALGSLEAAGLVTRTGIGSYERTATRHA